MTAPTRAASVARSRRAPTRSPKYVTTVALREQMGARREVLRVAESHDILALLGGQSLRERQLVA
ncbi:hypothetical protein RB628_18525 [Streptomyces sp. ADMS]|uniref:hypothetical protein n=1 Tax=Streptomyces sp. ADMS TaxID=3071415 RepID=UPI00296E6BB3|nr:hypothetical protein [Streptomyces sp. ADMS]MDW4907293.1 hypothetical protein [Streptomyces sp. ADMS]